MTWLESIRTSVPNDYRDYVDQLIADSMINDLVVIYSWPSVEERYSTHEMDTFLPTHIPIGNNSGDMDFLLRRDGSRSVYQCDAGGLGSNEPVEVHSDVIAWIAAGCPQPESDDISHPLQAPIWLIRAPEDGLKGMFELRKIFSKSWSASDLRSMMQSLPCLLDQDGQPFRMMRILEDRPAYLACLAWGDSSTTLTPLQT